MPDSRKTKPEHNSHIMVEIDGRPRESRKEMLDAGDLKARRYRRRTSVVATRRANR
jgi:hypothetical protein